MISGQSEEKLLAWRRGSASRARRGGSMLLALALISPAASSLAQSPPPSGEGDAAASAPQPKFAPLLGFVVQQIGSMMFQKVFKNEIDGIFKPLVDMSQNLIGVGPEAGNGPANERLVPTIGYSIDQLDPKSFDVLRTSSLNEATASLKTGDVFAIRYATNLPGQVRLENIDPAGQINDLGVYTVFPGATNRIPSDHGIKLVGQPGVEVIRLYFFPCVPGGPDMEALKSEFGNRLPACGAGQNPRVAAAAKGVIKTRSLQNLSQPDNKVSFSGASDYERNDVTSTALMIQHVKPE
ncbi:DUF4384 domain-containing protein [Propionivibrio dicarboxylicus]|uniref:Uncharacterized protein n=1 Tax=Propionivibrio dicarboxylicus TaxID=83767 RepID=A0A1G8A6V0_9RHOO|nr:DUF4384 domain-containing protein [Propionivibrio dicarboxylicus]SDH16674.1 hypothetical protein SAMN05660652_01300 [Propionivibrio dicarboxylicus]